MAEPSGSSDDNKKGTQYTATIATGLTTVVVWLANHKAAVEYKEPLTLAAPSIGLLTGWLIWLAGKQIQYYRDSSALKQWIAEAEEEYKSPATPPWRKKQIREEDLEDYRKQLREARRKSLRLFER